MTVPLLAVGAIAMVLILVNAQLRLDWLCLVTVIVTFVASAALLILVAGQLGIDWLRLATGVATHGPIPVAA